MSAPTDLLVPITPPTAPAVLCNTAFLTTLAAAEKQVAELRITDAQSAQAAANMLARLTSAGKQLDEARMALKRPYLDINAKIDEVARGPQGRIDAAKKTLQKAQIQFDIDQRRAAAEAEERRQAEIRRLEEQRAAEERETQRKAAAILAEQKRIADAAKASAPSDAPPEIDVDFGDAPAPPPKTETELALERAKFAPAPAAAKPVGLAFRVTLRAVAVDMKQVPDLFVIRTLKDTAVYSTFCQGWREGDPIPECPGLRFEVQRTAVSTGKAVF
jgi:hypothetical protein